ncbi:MAG TPA: hypothetical protein VFZ61_09525, partial [Polyangiales bacterium]
MLCVLPFAVGCGTRAERDEPSSGLDSAIEADDAGPTAADAQSSSLDADSAPWPQDAGPMLLVDVNTTPDTCADLEITPVRSIPSVTFLVDGSGSMDCVYPEDPTCDCDGQLFKRCTAKGSVSRWQALSQALFGAPGAPGLTESLGSSIRFGLWIYNNAPGAAACPGYAAQVAPRLAHAAQLAAAFPPKPPGYNTPTARALSALTETLPADAPEPHKIVLATDGQPFACQDSVKLDKPALDYQAVVDATRAAISKNVDLFVMSLAPAAGDFAAHLEQLAREGRTAHAYKPADKSELSAALNDIIASAISCSVTLNGSVPRPDACRGRATLGGTQLVCGDPDGFRLRDSSHVELVGEACRRFKHEPGIEL